MIRRSLVIGATGYVGRSLAEILPADGIDVLRASRRVGSDVVVAGGSDLDGLLEREHFDQIVLAPQLTAAGVDWLIDRIDGSRWVVLSSAQLASEVVAPGTELALAREETALARGATVLRPTMIFGRGGDANLSRIIRGQHRWKMAMQIGDGRQLVQPLHVADLVALLAHHCGRPHGGLFSVGGDEQIPTQELVEMVREILGIRLPVLRVPPRLVHLWARAGLPGLRRDQLLRLEEDKVVDNAQACAAFGWAPLPLAQRVEQAVREALA